MLHERVVVERFDGVSEEMVMMEMIEWLGYRPDIKIPQYFGTDPLFGLKYVSSHLANWSQNEFAARNEWEIIHRGTHLMTVIKHRYVIRHLNGKIIDPTHIVGALRNHPKHYKLCLPRMNLSGLWSRRSRRIFRSGLRHPQSFNEMKKAFPVKADGEPDLRGARKKGNLPNAYWDMLRGGQKCWKYQCKARKQWMR